MTKRLFVATAAILKAQVDAGITPVVIRPIAQEFADLFADNNPNFDRERFLAACGVEVTHNTQEETA